ncbi:chromate transporter [Acetobacter malorum]|uniref:chromate transporter n=1 Tax=Acetobacter malorum TaxID=178901 RepID=UPI003570DF57
MTIVPRGLAPEEQRTGSPREVFLVFLRLGVTCFGGPVAHIGYFRDEFVVRRRWLNEHAYADLVGLPVGCVCIRRWPRGAAIAA